MVSTQKRKSLTTIKWESWPKLISPNLLLELRAEVNALRQKISSVEQQAEIRVAVAEAEKEFLVEYVSNAKVLDHQITQMLQRINAKVPQLKGEVQMIKKHMQDFLHKAIPKQKKKEWLGAGEFSRKKYSNENTNKPH